MRKRLTFAGDMDSLIDEDRVWRGVGARTVSSMRSCRALQTLGVPLDPRVFVSPDDFTAEYAAGSVDEMFLGSF